MAEISRPNLDVQPFGVDAKNTGSMPERVIFGEAGTSDDLAENLNENYKRGWGKVGTNEKPPMEWFNGAMYTQSALTAYLYQAGIAKWNEKQTYQKNALTMYNGSFWMSKTAENIGNTPDDSPDEWLFIPTETASTEEATAGEDDTKIMTPKKVKAAFGSIDTSQIASGILPITRGGTGNTTGLAASSTKLVNARTLQTNLASTATASFDGTANVSPGVTGTLPIANGGTGNTTGLAASSTKLATARTVRTNLASTATASFDGTANIIPGVTGTLPIANGGTGATTRSAAMEKMLNSAVSGTPSHVFGMNYTTESWNNPGYISIANLKTALGSAGSIPVGGVFASVLEPDNTGTAKYIKLTYNDSYNSGLLTYSTPATDSGSPYMNYTAVVSLSTSPLYNKTIRLINSEKRYIRAGTYSTVYNDAIRNITGTIGDFNDAYGVKVGGQTGAIYHTDSYDTKNATSGGKTPWYPTYFDASRVVPTATENRVRTLEIEHYMRIL